MPAACCRSIRDNDDARAAGTPAAAARAVKAAATASDAGRDPERLAALADLGADTTVRLENADSADALARFACDVDVVIDYLWGPPTASAMTAIVTNRSDRGKPLTWIEIGSVAGRVAAIPSAALRAARLQIVGSGQGSVPTRDILAELPAIAAQITNIVGDAPTYLSFDIDALDPAFAPGTGTPEIGGLASWQVQAIIRRLKQVHFVGMDIVEVSPAFDVSEITALAAAIPFIGAFYHGWSGVYDNTLDHVFRAFTHGGAA